MVTGKNSEAAAGAPARNNYNLPSDEDAPRGASSPENNAVAIEESPGPKKNVSIESEQRQQIEAQPYKDVGPDHAIDNTESQRHLLLKSHQNFHHKQNGMLNHSGAQSLQHLNARRGLKS